MRISKIFAAKVYLYFPVFSLIFLLFYVAYDVNVDAENYRNHYELDRSHWEIFYNVLVELARAVGLSFDQFYFTFVALEALIATSVCLRLRFRAAIFLISVYAYLGDDVFGTQIRFGLSILLLCLALTTQKRSMSFFYLGLGALTHNVGLLAAALVLAADFFSLSRARPMLFLMSVVVVVVIKLFVQDILVALEYVVDPDSQFYGVKSISSIIFNAAMLFLIILSRFNTTPSTVNAWRLVNVCAGFLLIALLFYDSAMIGGRILFMALPLLAIYLGFKMRDCGRFSYSDWAISFLLVGLGFYQYLPHGL